jgi:hypothetical protein
VSHGHRSDELIPYSTESTLYVCALLHLPGNAGFPGTFGEQVALSGMAQRGLGWVMPMCVPSGSRGIRPVFHIRRHDWCGRRLMQMAADQRRNSIVVAQPAETAFGRGNASAA